MNKVCLSVFAISVLIVSYAGLSFAEENVLNFTATAKNDHAINLSWDSSNISSPWDLILIRSSETDYPKNTEDGNLVTSALGTGTTSATFNTIAGENSTLYFTAFLRKDASTAYSSGSYAKATTLTLPQPQLSADIEGKARTRDFQTQSSDDQQIENSTKTYTFVVGQDIGAGISHHALRVRYMAHSQSQTNYAKNGVKTRILKAGQVVAESTDEYDSQSAFGTPVPGFIHEKLFGSYWVLRTWQERKFIRPSKIKAFYSEHDFSICGTKAWWQLPKFILRASKLP